MAFSWPRLRPNRDKVVNEPFVANSMRDNWYQANSYYPLPFGLVSTVAESGITTIGPHSFTMPYGVIDDYALVLITRFNSNTAINLMRTKKCAVHFIEFKRSWLKDVVGLGYPGQEPEDKMKHSKFQLMDSPTPQRRYGDGRHPQLIKEAFQVYECSLDESVDYHHNKDGTSRHFILRIDNILLKQSYHSAINDGNAFMPDMPISYGFRDGGDFWFTRHRKPFVVPVPSDRGPKVEAVLYEANRIADDITWTRDAAQELTAVPKAFLKMALKGVVKKAQAEGVTEITQEFVLKVNEERKRK